MEIERTSKCVAYEIEKTSKVVAHDLSDSHDLRNRERERERERVGKPLDVVHDRACELSGILKGIHDGHPHLLHRWLNLCVSCVLIIRHTQKYKCTYTTHVHTTGTGKDKDTDRGTDRGTDTDAGTDLHARP
jgi:hypothetical protein